MIPKSLAINTDGPPRFSENIKFQIVDVKLSDVYRNQEQNEISSNQNLSETFRLKLEPVTSDCSTDVITPDELCKSSV